MPSYGQELCKRAADLSGRTLRLAVSVLWDNSQSARRPRPHGCDCPRVSPGDGSTRHCKWRRDRTKDGEREQQHASNGATGDRLQVGLPHLHGV